MAYVHLDEILRNFEGYPAHRIRLDPSDGTATGIDVLKVRRTEGVRCELFDGMLIEKASEVRESRVAEEVTRRIDAFVDTQNLGFVATGLSVELLPWQIRIPDSAYYSWDRLPGRMVPTAPIPAVYPNLAVEVLSESNTQTEMIRKLKDYFFAGTKLVWFIDPDSRTAQAFTAPDQFTTLTEADHLTGGDVLPGFSLNLGELFSAAGV